MKAAGFLVVMLVHLATLGADVNTDPWQLNVYTVEDIGKTNTPYGSDFQGAAGAGGDANFSGFSLNLNNYPVNSQFSLFTGGDVNFNSGTISNGGIEAGGNIFLNSASVEGGISGGGNLLGGSGTINGNVNIQGQKNNSPGLVINGSLNQNQSFTPTVSQSAVSSYFQNATQFWGGLQPTATVVDSFGQLQIQGLTSGRNVVSLTLDQINSAFGIAMNAPADAFVIFNITGATMPGDDFMKALSMQLNGGIAFDDVLFNILEAAMLSMQGGVYTSLLAPNTDITFSSGLLQGNLIAQNLYGSGQVNLGPFTGFSVDQHNFVPVPEPMTWLTLATLLMVVLYAKTRRQAVVH